MLAVVPIVGMALVIAFVLQVPLTKRFARKIRLKLERPGKFNHYN